ncbi:MAG: hypothetical protein ABH822_00695 [Patescibacteria group bacterium]
MEPKLKIFECPHRKRGYLYKDFDDDAQQHIDNCPYQFDDLQKRLFTAALCPA